MLEGELDALVLAKQLKVKSDDLDDEEREEDEKLVQLFGHGNTIKELAKTVRDMLNKTNPKVYEDVASQGTRHVQLLLKV